MALVAGAQAGLTQAAEAHIPKPGAAPPPSPTT